MDVNMNEKKRLMLELTCTRCNEEQDTYGEIVYSQGNRVCLKCKKITQPDDNRAFDSYMRVYRGIEWWIK